MNTLDQPIWRNTIYARIVRIIDLDTFRVCIWDRGIPYFETLRLANVNAPESRGWSQARFLAESDVSTTLTGLIVRIDFDLHQSQRDRFGRLIGFVSVESNRASVCVNELLLRVGYARHWFYSFTKQLQLSNAELQAFVERRGIWNRALDWNGA